MDEKKNERLLSRRDFLSGMKKWSKVVIAAAVATTVGGKAHAGAWVNRRGGRGGGAWGNGGGTWANRHGGGGWLNRR